MSTNFYLRSTVEPVHPLHSAIDIHIGKRSSFGGGAMIFNFQGFRNSDVPRQMGIDEGNIFGWSDWRAILTGTAGNIDADTVEVVDEYGQVSTPQEFIQEIESDSYPADAQIAYFKKYHLNDDTHALTDGFNVSFVDFS